MRGSAVKMLRVLNRVTCKGKSTEETKDSFRKLKKAYTRMSVKEKENLKRSF